MARVLLVGQETGGVGKSTIVRGLAEAVEEAAIFEVESVHRLVEFKKATKANIPGSCWYFDKGASRKEINDSGGEAALSEHDGVINAISRVTIPTIVDIGANKSASLFGMLDPTTVKDLDARGIELGVVLVVAEEAGSIEDADHLNRMATPWAKARFIIANDVRGTVDPDEVNEIAAGAAVTQLQKYAFEKSTAAILQASALRGIRNINRDALIKEKELAAANRILRSLTAFRLGVMEAVKPAAKWLANVDA